MVTYELKQDATLTSRERQLIREAKNLPPVFDEDSPELTPDMEKAFIAAGKEKPSGTA